MSNSTQREFIASKRKLMQALLFEAGAALFDCQGFEYSLAYLLFHLSRLGTPGLSKNWTVSVLDQEVKVTAGRLIQVLRKHARISPNLQSILEEALRARNYLVHRILMEDIELIMTQQGRDHLTREVASLRIKVQQAEKALKPYIENLALLLDGIDFDALRAQAIEAFFDNSTDP